MSDRIQQLLDAHRSLDLALRKPEAPPFISGWETWHPYEHEYLSPPPLGAGLGAYRFMSDQLDLVELIRKFHARRDHVVYSVRQILPTVGSSPLVLGAMAFAKDAQVDNVLYVPPVYYSFHYFARLLDIRMVPAASAPLLAPDDPLQLPDTKSILILTDPIWCAGVDLSAQHVSKLAKWQDSTKSTIIVDGTFQYLKWLNNTVNSELTASLDQDRTVRILCPTKCLAIHGLRFAYALVPEVLREELRYSVSNVTGGSGEANINGSKEAMRTLLSPSSNSGLLQYIESRYHQLHEQLFTEPLTQPNTGYYVMARLKDSYVERCLAMTGSMFELNDNDGRVRINLLAPPSILRRIGVA